MNCSNSIVSSTFTIPDCLKNNKDFLNKYKHHSVEKVRESVKIIKISQNKLDKILERELLVKVRESCYEDNLPSSKKEENLHLDDWNKLPQEVKDKILQLTKQKKSRKYENCPCKYTHGLIQLYHNAQSLREKIEKLKISNSREKLHNQIFKDDSSSVLQTEIKNTKCKLEELKTISKNVTENLKIHSQLSFENHKCLNHLIKRTQEIRETVKKFESHGKIFKLKQEQQIIDDAFIKQSIRLEENEQFKAKTEIQMRLNSKEEWTKQDKCYDLERNKERQTDNLLVLKSITLMDKHIEELKNKSIL